MKISYLIGFVLLCFTSIGKPLADTIKTKQPASVIIAGRPASIGIIGDTANVNTPTQSGVVMMGGGKDVDAAFRWMIGRSGGGDVVILRASGTDAYNPYIYALGKVNSVETLKINSRALANNDTVACIIRNAEMLFIAGGDQSNYMKFWKGTKTMDAINYLVNVKHIPVGGTSAGCAILGGFYYSGEGGSITAEQALANPYDSLATIYNNDFVHIPFLKHVITDQHYLTRSRQGRHIAFLARITTDWNIAPEGIAVNERTALCMDENGKASVLGSSKAYFAITDQKKRPEVCQKNQPLTWNRKNKAIKVYEIQGAANANNSFDIANFKPLQPETGTWYWWWAEKGQLKQEMIKE